MTQTAIFSLDSLEVLLHKDLVLRRLYISYRWFRLDEFVFARAASMSSRVYGFGVSLEFLCTGYAFPYVLVVNDIRVLSGYLYVSI
jgi:hypothetical protein